MMRYQTGFKASLKTAMNARRMKTKANFWFVITATITYVTHIVVALQQSQKMIGTVRLALKKWNNKKGEEKKEKQKGGKLEC